MGQHYGAARRPTTSNRDQGRGPAVPGPGRDPETRSRVPRRTNSKRYANFGSKKRADPSGGEETRLGNWKSVPCSVQFGVQFSSGSVRVQFSSGSPSGESMKRPTSPGLGAWPSILATAVAESNTSTGFIGTRITTGGPIPPLEGFLVLLARPELLVVAAEGVLPGATNDTSKIAL